MNQSTHSYKTIYLEYDEGLAVVTLNRPDNLNSLNQDMFDDLNNVFDQIVGNPDVRCLLITGSGRGFCAGQDLADLNFSDDAPITDIGELVEKNYNPLVRRIAALEIPVICAVNGVAAGAGSSVALNCDLVFAGRSASFIQSFCKIGLIPDTGGSWHLPRLVGRARALGLALLGDKLSAEDAEKWGLIWKCVDDDQLMIEAIKVGKYLATQPTAGLGMVKRSIRESMDSDLDNHLNLERELMGKAGNTYDYQEGVKAFIEKRPAKFLGK